VRGGLNLPKLGSFGLKKAHFYGTLADASVFRQRDDTTAASMQSEIFENDTSVSGETAGRAVWRKPRVIVSSVAEDTEGAFIPGPAEIPRSCS
jgi:hypothetical protein